MFVAISFHKNLSLLITLEAGVSGIKSESVHRLTERDFHTLIHVRKRAHFAVRLTANMLENTTVKNEGGEEDEKW